MSFWDGSRWVDERPALPLPVVHRRRRLRDIAATIPIIFLVPALLSPFMSAGAAGAQLSVSGIAVAGGHITAIGSNFSPKDWIHLSWDGSTNGLPTVRVNSRSEFSVDLTVPSSATAGAHTLAAVGASKQGRAGISSATGAIASVTVDVLGTTPTPTPTPAAAATPTPTPAPIATPTPTPIATPLACPAGQFLAEYFANRTLSGIPARVACEATIAYIFGTSGPAGLPADSFSVRWTGSFSFAAATYTFSATSDDGSRLYVDGSIAIDAWVDQGATTRTATRTLTSGTHNVRYEYYEGVGDAEARLTWTGSVAPTATPTPTPAVTSAPTPTPTPAASPSPTPTPSASCGPSIQSRVDAAAAGSTVTIPACIYRERVAILKPITLVAQPGAEIRGSDVWTGWSQSGSTWISANTDPSLYNVGGTCSPGSSRCLWNEQAFFDGNALYQVSTTSTPGPGEFKVDGSRHIVIGQNPSGHLLEVSTRENWIWVGASDVVIDGFRMKHASTWTQGGGINIGGNWVGAVNRVTVKNCDLSGAHGRDIAIEGGTGHRILNNDIGRAGNIGIGGSGGSDWVISGNSIHDNDTEGFDVGIESGGAKILDVDGLVVSNNEVAYNTRGIWTDTLVRNATFSNNRLHDNGYNGLFLESSHYLTVTGNTAWENGWAPNAATWAWGGGITLSSSDHANVYGNALAWNADGITVISQSRTDDAPHVENNIHDNTIAMAPKSGDSTAFATGWFMDWSGILFNASSNNRGSNNHYWYSGSESTQSRFAWNGFKSRLADYEPTPAETTTIYLTTAQKDDALSAVGVPTTAIPR